MKKLNRKLKLNKEAISSLENEEMNNLLAGEAPNCWQSRIACGNTGLRTTCRTNSCSNDENWEICLLCLTVS
jgi:hypothetical protein